MLLHAKNFFFLNKNEDVKICKKLIDSSGHVMDLSGVIAAQLSSKRQRGVQAGIAIQTAKLCVINQPLIHLSSAKGGVLILKCIFIVCKKN